MKKPLVFAAAFTSLVLSISSEAAKPVKITPADKGDLNGVEYRNYIVECSNGKRQVVASWDGGKKWCVGKDSPDNCAKKQIKAAKTACKLD